MKLSGSEIRKQEFPIKLRGYDRLDVDAFLQMVADSVDELLRRNEELAQQCAELSQKIRGLEERDETLQRALVAVSELREEANRRVADLLAHAEGESGRLLAQAEEEARRVREDSTREMERVREEVSGLVRLREKMVRDLFEMLRAQLRVVEGESERLREDAERLAGGEGGKIISLNPKAEGERS